MGAMGGAMGVLYWSPVDPPSQKRNKTRRRWRAPPTSSRDPGDRACAAHSGTCAACTTHESAQARRATRCLATARRPEPPLREQPLMLRSCYGQLRRHSFQPPTRRLASGAPCHPARCERRVMRPASHPHSPAISGEANTPHAADITLPSMSPTLQKTPLSLTDTAPTEWPRL